MEVKILRKQVYDPYRGEFVYEIIPTDVVKRSRSTGGGAGTVGAFGSYSIGPGSVARMTYMHLELSDSDRQAVAGEISLIDRYGTCDKTVLRTGSAAYKPSSTARYAVQGGLKAPVHTLYGTVKFYKNATVVGTVSASYELILVAGMPNREGTVTRK